MFPFRENVEAGGLMSYGARDDLYRRAATYVDKIERSSKDTTLNRDDGPRRIGTAALASLTRSGFPIEAAWAAKLAAVSRKAALCCFSSSINAVRSALASRRSRRWSCFRCRRAFPNIAIMTPPKPTKPTIRV
jgi:hypothetical protein